MKKFWFRIPLTLVVFGLWVLLLFPLSLEEFVTGVVITLFLLLIPLPGREVFGDFSLYPKKIVYGVLYLFYFLLAVIRSNIDVASRVLKPTLPINPGVVKVKTVLKSRVGRLVLANSITLTPGTITVDIEDENLYIHWIDISSDSPEVATREIVKGFEKYLEVIFG